MWGPATVSRGHRSHVGDMWAKGPGRVARAVEASASRPPADFSRPLWAGGLSMHRSFALVACAQAPGPHAGQTPPPVPVMGAAALGRTASRGRAWTHVHTWGCVPSVALSVSAWLGPPLCAACTRTGSGPTTPRTRAKADSRPCPWLGSQRPPPSSPLGIPQSPGSQGCMVSPYLSHSGSICTRPGPRS